MLSEFAPATIHLATNGSVLCIDIDLGCYHVIGSIDTQFIHSLRYILMGLDFLFITPLISSILNSLALWYNICIGKGIRAFF